MALLTNSTVNHSNMTGTSLVFTNPSSTVGDLLVCGISTGGSSVAVTPPSGQGWVNFANSASSGNSGAFLRFYRRSIGASDPTSFAFTFGANDTANGFIVAITGADPTTPIDGSVFTNVASGGGRTQTTGQITPSILGCLPIAMFGAQQIDTGTPGAASTTSNFTLSYIESTTNATYHPSAGTIGSLTSDTTTPISSALQWASQYTTTTGATALILIRPQTPGNITFSPTQLNLAGPGASAVVTVNQTGSSSAITLSSSNTATATVSPTSVQPGGTATVTAIAAGTFALNALGA